MFKLKITGRFKSHETHLIIINFYYYYLYKCEKVFKNMNKWLQL